jgi:VanZ family protein
MALGALDELRQAFLPQRSADAMDFFADLCGALLAAGALSFFAGGKAKPCAESSPR